MSAELHLVVNVGEQPLARYPVHDFGFPCSSLCTRSHSSVPQFLPFDHVCRRLWSIRCLQRPFTGSLLLFCDCSLVSTSVECFVHVWAMGAQACTQKLHPLRAGPRQKHKNENTPAGVYIFFGGLGGQFIPQKCIKQHTKQKTRLPVYTLLE